MNVALIGGGAGTLATGLMTGNMIPFGLIAGGIAANHGAAKLMASPRFVNWLAQSTKPKINLPAHIAKLSAIANAEGLNEEIDELLETLKDVD